jgi:hypothetical protein
VKYDFSLAQIWREGAHEEEEGEKWRSSAQTNKATDTGEKLGRRREIHLYLVDHSEELAGLHAQAPDMASISKRI